MSTDILMRDLGNRKVASLLYQTLNPQSQGLCKTSTQQLPLICPRSPSSPFPTWISAFSSDSHQTVFLVQSPVESRIYILHTCCQWIAVQYLHFNHSLQDPASFNLCLYLPYCISVITGTFIHDKHISLSVQI